MTEMADGALNLLKSSLSSLGSLWGSIAEKTNEAHPQIKSFVCESVEKLMKETHTLAKSSITYSEEKVIQVIPYIKRYVGFTENKVREYLPLLKSFVILGKEKVNEAIPYVKSFVELSMKTIKQHPYLTGFILLLVLWIYKGGSAPKKMMKAPGRDHMMPRANFERSPRNYFADLRNKKT